MCYHIIVQDFRAYTARSKIFLFLGGAVVTSRKRRLNHDTERMQEVDCYR